MKLSDFAIKRPVAMLMIVVVIMILGFVSISKMSIDLLPNVDVPVIVVMTVYPGAASEEIEDTITKPIEKYVSGVENVKTILSDSQPNVSAVQVKFKWGTDLDIAAMNVREKLDLIKRDLPESAEEPVVMKLDPSMMPVLILGMEGQRDTMYLRQLADDTIVKQLERVEGVSSVKIVGGAERQIRVRVYPDKLSGYKVAFSQVISALKAGNINVPAGEVDYGNRELLVKTTGEFIDVEEIKNLVVVNRQGAIVRLRDIADIQDTQEEVKIYSRINENEGLRILVQKQSDANSVRVAEKVKSALAEIEKTLPPDIEITEILDQSNYIQRSIN
ncbi:MAG: efflux RND transporter permease subunit, partial [Tepidanaerobacteraceae bacterium]|nr:efflux RND transporter permease subunit [Tepidanaerobacteraceae bacterium]